MSNAFGIKLKKTTTVDKSAPVISSANAEADAAKEYHMMASLVLMERWYKLIEPYTFKTIFFEIPRHVAMVLIAAQKRVLTMPSNLSAPSSSSSTVLAAKQELDLLLQGDDSEFIQWYNTLESTIATNFHCNSKQKDEQKFVFLKTTQRSPKDVFATSYKNLYTEFIKDLQKFTPEEQQHNSYRIWAMNIAAISLMKIQNASEALEMLISSNRVYEDLLEHYVEFGGSSAQEDQDKKKSQQEEEQHGHKSEGPISLALREWDNDIDITMEFRAFINNYQLNAISQYNYLIHVPFMCSHSDHILQMMQLMYTDKILPILQKQQIHQCTVDYVVYKTRLEQYLLQQQKQEGDQSSAPIVDITDCIKIIELNPLREGTGTAMFDWKTEKHILHNGPFEFRYVKEPVQSNDKRFYADMDAAYRKMFLV